MRAKNKAQEDSTIRSFEVACAWKGGVFHYKNRESRGEKAVSKRIV